MKTYTKEELAAILKSHALWIQGNKSGAMANLEEANLKGANLEEANLGRANLEWANLKGANLEEANLGRANLEWANLEEANLVGANLEWANLRLANLRVANLGRANLEGANLVGANLVGATLVGANLVEANLGRANLRVANLGRANLEGANLVGANLEGANLEGATLPYFQIFPEEGDFIAWKKVTGGILKLLIPKEARRTSSLVGRKCRAEFVVVLEGSGVSQYNSKIQYAPGMTVYPDKYNDDIRVECTSGIHFFMTKREAEEY